MLIAVDIGNTNIVLGMLEGERVTNTYRITTKANYTKDEYGVIITQFLTLSELTAADVEAVIIASVVPNVMHSFVAAIRTYLHTDPMIVSSAMRTGMDILIDDPRSLGVDCLADCVGAVRLYGAPVLVADFGTATTFNYVNGEANIVSGLITPGIRTAASALWNTAAQLPEIEITKPATIMTTATDTAMQAGLYYGFLGSIERIIKEFHDAVGEEFTVVTTGGLGRLFANETSLIDVYNPDLIFVGLAAIYELNQ